MNYTTDSLDIPTMEPEDCSTLPDLYDQGMSDFWYHHTDRSLYYFDEYKAVYQAGRNNARMILKTLRANF